MRASLENAAGEEEMLAKQLQDYFKNEPLDFIRKQIICDDI